MSVEYTPDTDHVRDIYVQGRSLLAFYSEGRLAEDMRNGAAFDRWLAEHDAQVAAKALREWAAAHLANYPEDVFVPPTRDDWDWVARLISQHGGVLDAFSAEIMRRAAHIAIKDADAMTRQADASAAPSDPPRKGNGPCNMVHPHGPHRWGDRDVTNLPWTCPGLAPGADDEGGRDR